METCNVSPSSPEDLCQCGHVVGSHLYPAGFCMECFAEIVERAMELMEDRDRVRISRRRAFSEAVSEKEDQ